MGGWRDSSQALPQRPPTPPVEPWDCDLKEELEATAPTSTPTREEDEGEEEENWDTASDELSWEHMPPPATDYSGVPTPEEEEEGLAAAEASLPIKENDEGIWFRCESPCWRVREEWKQASYAQRVDMEKYCLVHGPDIRFHQPDTPSEETSSI